MPGRRGGHPRSRFADKDAIYILLFLYPDTQYYVVRLVHEPSVLSLLESRTACHMLRVWQAVVIQIMLSLRLPPPLYSAPDSVGDPPAIAF